MMPALDFSGRCVLVTGAAGAVGTAVMDEFKARGAHVVGLDLLSDTHATGQAVNCDVTDESSVRSALAKATAQRRPTDFVHAAGIATTGTVYETPVEVVRRILDVNLLSCFIVAREFLSLCEPGATFTVISSQAAIHGAANWSAYGASKAGTLRFIEALAQECGPRGVRVNAVCPGSVRSPMMRAIIKRLSDETGATTEQITLGYETANPLGRMAEPSDVANACVFLASELATYVNGAALMVDGGDRPG